MNLRTLQYLIALDELRHFGRAAIQCHVSQPTLSAQIKKLEQEIGVTLVERRHKNVMLTPVGRRVVKRAQKIHGLVNEIKTLARHHQDPLAGELALGFIPTLGPYLLPHIVGPLSEALPDMAYFFAEHKTADLVTKLGDGELDAVFVAVPHGQFAPVPLAARELFEERFVVAMPAEHALSQQSAVRGDQLAAHGLLLLQDGHCLRDQALDVCGIEPDTPQRTMAATSLETLRQMVAAGQGVTLMPELSVHGDDDRSRTAIRPLEHAQPSRTIAALWRQSSVRAAAIERICDLVVATMAAALPP